MEVDTGGSLLAGSHPHLLMRWISMEGEGGEGVLGVGQKRGAYSEPMAEPNTTPLGPAGLSCPSASENADPNIGAHTPVCTPE